MKKILAFLLTVFATVSFSACGLFYRDEPAPALQIPERSQVLDFTVYRSGEGHDHVEADEEQIENALAFLHSAVPTKRESVNDSPTREVYYVFDLDAEGEYGVYGYFYEDKRLFGLISEWYFEIPYYGIYEVSETCASALISR